MNVNILNMIISAHGFLTLEALQRVVTSLLLADKEAITVQEVGPGHLDPVKGVAALLTHGLAGGATGLQHHLPLTARRQHGAAQHADFRVALAPEQRLHHAQQEVLGARLGLFAGLVAEDVGEHGLSVGHVVAVGQQHIGAFG